MSEIVSGLLVSNYQAANDEKLLFEHQITLRLNVSNLEDTEVKGVQMVNVNIEDAEDVAIWKWFSKMNRLIYNHRLKGGVVLVHCMQGASRSLCLVTAYLAGKHKYKQKKLTLREAQHLVKSKVPEWAVNPGFWRQLNQFYG